MNVCNFPITRYCWFSIDISLSHTHMAYLCHIQQVEEGFLRPHWTVGGASSSPYYCRRSKISHSSLALRGCFSCYRTFDLLHVSKPPALAVIFETELVLLQSWTTAYSRPGWL